jgi:hypothetical protein
MFARGMIFFSTAEISPIDGHERPRTAMQKMIQTIGRHGVARILRWNKRRTKVVMKMILIDLDCAISCRFFKIPLVLNDRPKVTLVECIGFVKILGLHVGKNNFRGMGFFHVFVLCPTYGF